jgi:hypothetical protein
VVRVLGLLKDTEAREAIEGRVMDGHWLVRANVARALGQIGDPASLPKLRILLSDRVAKVHLSALDGLASFGAAAGPAWSDVADHLGSRSWQVRVAAAACLGALGERRAIEPLIARMEIEGGRVRKDIREALKLLTRDDLGENPEHWRDWWEKEKARTGKAPPPPPPPAGKDRYSAPTYYGLRVYSARIAYVIDTSASMAFAIRIDPAWLAKNERAYPAHASKYALARHEVEASLRALDPRARLNLYFFRTVASRWKTDLVPAGGRTIDAVIGRLATEAPPPGGGGEGYRTNYVDVLRLVLGEKKDALPGPKLARTADTVFFLTDGKPSVGDIRKTEELRLWFRERNRFARVRFHVIVFGKTDVDAEFLRRLAKENDGVFVQVPQAK